MYQGFQIKVPETCFRQYEDDGRNAYQSQKNNVRSTIDSFKNSDETLDASKITADWFPNIESDVFISHSKKDSALAVGLAGFLNYEFGLTSFVDSCVWGYSDDLLKLIDDRYCWQPNNRTYNYTKRNRSTSHVNMMLTAALSKEINKSECVIFLNTPSSLLTSDYIDDYATDSPWIYVELAMTKLVQKRSPSEHRELAKSQVQMDEALRIRYALDIDHLKEISIDDLKTWRKAMTGVTGPRALDFLYNLK